MRFEELDTRLRIYETAHDHCVMPEMYIVVRLDGRGFTRKTKVEWKLQAPFDKKFHDIMAQTTKHLMECGFNVLYGYTQSDEISLLLHPSDNLFNRKLRKINSVLAGEASGFFSLQMGDLACFDARVCQLPNSDLVAQYFRWRQEDAHRNSLNAHCYWLKRHQGIDPQKATDELSGMALKDKHDLLYQHNMNFNNLPLWQKRGVGLYKKNVEKEGFNPLTQEKTLTSRNQIIIDDQLLLGDEYGDFIMNLLNVSSV